MGQGKRLLPAVSMLPAATAAFMVAQVVRAAHRPDLPSCPNQDPSGIFGDPSAPPLRMVALGDSSITAPGVADLDNVWVRRAALDFAAEHRVDLISLAVGGSKVRDVVEGQLDAAVALSPDVAVVSIGANDVMRATPVSWFRRDLEHILTQLERTAGAILVMGVGDLGSIPRLPASLRPYLTHRSRVFDALSAAVAVAHPACIKIYTRGPISQAFWNQPSLFAADMFHAGDAGHAIFASESMPTFRAALALAKRRRGDRPAG